MDTLIDHVSYARDYQKRARFCAMTAQNVRDIMDGLNANLMPSIMQDYRYWTDKAAYHAGKARFHLFKALEG